MRLRTHVAVAINTTVCTHTAIAIAKSSDYKFFCKKFVFSGSKVVALAEFTTLVTKKFIVMRLPITAQFPIMLVDAKIGTKQNYDRRLYGTENHENLSSQKVK